MAVSQLPTFGTSERATVKRLNRTVDNSGEVEVIKALIKNVLGAGVVSVEYNFILPGQSGRDRGQHQFTAVSATERNSRTFVTLEAALQPVFQRDVNSVATTLFACQVAFDGTGA